ncbi:MAG: hypothetical protein KGL53_04790, partial [Elusimicrobia bacterium]|nr:hypothetical protein [Elusimicrobiota bacterium]
MKRFIAATVSTFILLGCPGLRASEAFAQAVTVRPVEAPAVPSLAVPVGALGAGLSRSSLPTLTVPLTLPSYMSAAPFQAALGAAALPRAAASA